jgi:hypothetical protein
MLRRMALVRTTKHNIPEDGILLPIPIGVCLTALSAFSLVGAEW